MKHAGSRQVRIQIDAVMPDRICAPGLDISMTDTRELWRLVNRGYDAATCAIGEYLATLLDLCEDPEHGDPGTWTPELLNEVIADEDQSPRVHSLASALLQYKIDGAHPYPAASLGDDAQLSEDALAAERSGNEREASLLAAIRARDETIEGLRRTERDLGDYSQIRGRLQSAIRILRACDLDSPEDLEFLRSIENDY